MNSSSTPCPTTIRVACLRRPMPTLFAYLLQMNDFPAGDSELPTSMDALMQMKMFADDGGDR